MKNWLGFLLLFIFILKVKCEPCSSNYIKCGTGPKCVSHAKICDGSNDCIDGSDEDTRLCSTWPFQNSMACSKGQYYCSSQYTTTTPRYHRRNQVETKSCRGLEDACKARNCDITIDSYVCETITSGVLPNSTESSPKLSTTDVIMLSDAVNSTLNHPACPMLYTRVAGQCLAIFTPSRLTWSEANQFCGVIFGQLVTFPNITYFAGLQRYLIAKEMTSEYWIGGRYEVDVNKWTYVNGLKMPLGSPYWAVRFSHDCQKRIGLQENSTCYNYFQAPTNTLGYCSTLSYELYYYISDESCLKKKIPICVYTGKKSGEWVDEG